MVRRSISWIRDSRLLPLAALIVGAFCAFHAAPAAAQTIVWSATLTVDGVGGDFGCSNSNTAQDNCSSASVLTQDEFTYRGVTYTVVLARRTSLGLIFDLALEGLSGSAAKTALGALTLKVDGHKLAVSRAGTSATSGFRHLLRWTYPGSSRWMDAQQVRLSLTAPPAKPTGFTARAGNAQVRLGWSDPGDSSITQYQYQLKAGATDWGDWTDIPNSAPGGANAISYTIVGLMKGVAYQFRIRAVNAAGNGAQSEAAGPVTPAGPVVPTVAAALWSATLTVGVSNVHTTHYGCGPFAGMGRCTSSTVLSDDVFTYGGTTYRVTQLYWRSDRNRLYLRLNSLLSTPVKSAHGSLALNVDGHQIAVGDTISTSILVSWPFDPGRDWTDGQRVALRLAPVGAPTVALTASSGPNKLLGNTGQPASAYPITFKWDMAQRFTTGHDPSGYRLTHVDVGIKDGAKTAPAYSVTIHASTDRYVPGRVLGRLTNPGSLPRGDDQVARFTAPGGGIDLAPRSEYFVVIDASAPGDRRVTVSTAKSGAVDRDVVADCDVSHWGISNLSLRRKADSTGRWTKNAPARRLQMAVYGVPKEAPPPDPALVPPGAIWSASLTVSRIGGGLPYYGCGGHHKQFDKCAMMLSDDDFAHGRVAYMQIPGGLDRESYGI